jgi:hypothetical protein
MRRNLRKIATNPLEVLCVTPFLMQKQQIDVLSNPVEAASLLFNTTPLTYKKHVAICFIA